MMKQTVTSISAMQSPEGIRVAYTYSEIGAKGEIVSRHNQGYFLADTDAELAAVKTLMNAASARLTDHTEEAQPDANA